MRRPSRASKPHPRIVARLSESALRGNYRVISALAGGQRILPMIKANAYGHDAVWAARVLAKSPQLYGFGVATLEEAEGLRQLSRIPQRTPILVFSGTSPWSEALGQRCQKHGLTPVISSPEDWAAFSAGRFFGKLPYELKFNTGMNRLGLQLSLAGELAALFAKKPKARPRGVCSHLAMAEKPDSPLSRRQLEAFVALRGTLEASLSGASAYHLANSSAIWNSELWGLGELTDLVRPGISLYGVPPWEGAPAQGLTPVMSLEACVIGIKDLRAGDAVGYGARYTCQGNPGRVAILSAGYADGVLRNLSDRGKVILPSGVASRFAGTISMDLSAIEIPDGVRLRTGEFVRLLGPGIEPWAQASLAGTIPYELLTSVSGRVQRDHAR